MQRLGKSQIPLPFETSGAREQDGQAPHKEAGPMCSPNIRVDIAQGTQIEKVILVLATECVRQVLAALGGRRYGNQRISRGLSQGR